jgi:hypothetical protein
MPQRQKALFAPETREGKNDIQEVLEAARSLYKTIDQYMPGQLFPEAVEDDWRRLGEALAWLSD